MSNDHERAGARDRAALEWLAGYDPADGYGAGIGWEAARDPAMMFTQPVVIDAFNAGVDHADAEFVIERATGQRQLDEAAAVMREAAELFRSYEAHHRLKVDKTLCHGSADPAEEKAERNALMAARLEAWLAGESTYPVNPAEEEAGLAEAAGPGSGLRTNVRPVTTGPLADPEVVKDILAVSNTPDTGRSLSMATATAFRLHTGDPRFDHTQPVVVNGYLFEPHGTVEKALIGQASALVANGECASRICDLQDALEAALDRLDAWASSGPEGFTDSERKEYEAMRAVCCPPTTTEA